MTDTRELTLGGYQGPGSVHTRGLERLRDALHSHAGDRITAHVRANMGEDGHKTADLPALVERGEIDICYVASSYLAGRVPALALFDMPFAAPDRDRAMALLDGALGQRFADDIAAKTDLALIGVWDNGLRHISTAERVLRGPDDARGLVLRTLPNDDQQHVFKAVGFAPQVIDARDLHAAVVRGEVDAQENPLTNTLNFDLHKTLPMVTLTGHLMGIALLLVNRSRLESLPDDLRAALLDAAAEATRAQRDFAGAEDAACRTALSEAGATLCSLSEPEHAAWRAAAEPEIARRRAKLDPDLLALFDADGKAAE